MSHDHCRFASRPHHGFASTRTGRRLFSGLALVTASAFGCGGEAPDAPEGAVPAGDPVSAPACTFHFSTSGNDKNPGTVAAPKRSLAHAAVLMTPGAVICLKRDDLWWLGASTWSVAGKTGTAQKPIVVQDYGTGSLPVVAAIDPVTSGWQAEGSGRWSRALSGYADVKRLLVDGHGRRRVALADLSAENEYAIDSGKIHLMQASDPSSSFIEVIPASGESALRLSSSTYVTFRNIRFGGGHNETIAVVPPTAHVSLEGLEVRKWGGQGIFFQHTGGSGYHESPRVVDSVLDKVSSTDENVDPYDSPGPGGDGIWISATRNGVVQHNHVLDSGHCAISVAVDVAGTLVERNETAAVNTNYQHALCLGGQAHDNVIRRNFFHDERHAAAHLNGDHNLIYSNLFVGARWTAGARNLAPHGADVSDFEGELVAGNVFVNNTFYDTDWSSIAIYDAPGQGTIGQNVFKNNLFVRFGQMEGHPGFGLSMGGVKNAEQVVAHNLFWRSTAGEKVILHYGVAYTAAEADAALGTFASNLQADPRFVNAAGRDFHLAAGSPAHGAGEDVSALVGAGFVDYDGKPFDPAHPSIGAFQD